MKLTLTIFFAADQLRYSHWRKMKMKRKNQVFVHIFSLVYIFIDDVDDDDDGNRMAFQSHNLLSLARIHWKFACILVHYLNCLLPTLSKFLHFAHILLNKVARYG